MVPLTDGSAVSVTVARYQTPNGTDINKIGIQLDASAPKVAPKEEGGEPAELRWPPEAFCAAVETDAASRGNSSSDEWMRGSRRAERDDAREDTLTESVDC